jgi:VID27 C-terminal WD40-like domain
VVVGSDDGKIRLFSSSTLTMAKTSIPGLGAPITAVDVAYDSKWVLATTNKYLMVVKTQFRDKAGRCVFGGWLLQVQASSNNIGYAALCMQLYAWTRIGQMTSSHLTCSTLSSGHTYRLTGKCESIQGDERVPGEDGRAGTSAEATAPQGRGPGQGGPHCFGVPVWLHALEVLSRTHDVVLPHPAGGPCGAAEGQVHMDHRGWPPGALDRGLLRRLHSAVELQVGWPCRGLSAVKTPVFDVCQSTSDLLATVSVAHPAGK